GMAMVWAGLQRPAPATNTTDRAYRRGEPSLLGRPAKRQRVTLPRLVCLQGAEVDIGVNVRLYDANKARLNLSCIDLRNVPQVAVEAIFAWREHAQLRAALAAIEQEYLGVQHLVSEAPWKRVGKGLAGAQGHPVLACQAAVLPVGDANLGLADVEVEEEFD